jgi:hypothetical protein
MLTIPVQTGELPVKYNKDGTIAKIAPPKETREFNGKSYVMEEAIFGDVAFVKVAKADRLGNCTFRKAQNNFNEAMGKNAKMTIVEADEIVEDGEIAPENVHLQGVYVKRVIKSTEDKKIERLVYYKDPEEQKKALLEGGKLSQALSVVKPLTSLPRKLRSLPETRAHHQARCTGTQGRNVRQPWNRHAPGCTCFSPRGSRNLPGIRERYLGNGRLSPAR